MEPESSLPYLQASAWGLGEALTTPPRKKIMLRNTHGRDNNNNNNNKPVTYITLCVPHMLTTHPLTCMIVYCSHMKMPVM